MSVDLSSLALVDAELLETIGYRSSTDTALAIRFRNAVTRLLMFPERSRDADGREMEYSHASLRLMLSEANQFIDSLTAGSVVHADWSTFGQYGGGG